MAATDTADTPTDQPEGPAWAGEQREVERHAANIEAETEARNTSIRAMREAGASYRLIGKAAGISDVTVMNIVDPSRRTDPAGRRKGRQQ